MERVAAGFAHPEGGIMTFQIALQLAQIGVTAVVSYILINGLKMFNYEQRRKYTREKILRYVIIYVSLSFVLLLGSAVVDSCLPIAFDKRFAEQKRISQSRIDQKDAMLKKVQLRRDTIVRMIQKHGKSCREFYYETKARSSDLSRCRRDFESIIYVTEQPEPDEPKI